MRNRCKTLFTQGSTIGQTALSSRSVFGYHTLFSRFSSVCRDDNYNVDIQDVLTWKGFYTANQEIKPWPDISEETSDKMKEYLDIKCKIYSSSEDLHTIVFSKSVSLANINDACRKLEAADISVFYNLDENNSRIRLFGSLTQVFDKLHKAYQNNVMDCKSNRL